MTRFSSTMFSTVVTAIQSSVLAIRKSMTNFHRCNFSAVSSLNYTLHNTHCTYQLEHNSHDPKFWHILHKPYPFDTIFIENLDSIVILLTHINLSLHR